MTLKGFGPQKSGRTITEVVFPSEYGMWGIFKWPRPLLESPYKTNPIEALMAVYSLDEMRYIVATITSRARPVSFERTTTAFGLDEAVKAWEILTRDTLVEADQYNLGTNVNTRLVEDTGRFLQNTNAPLFQILTADEAGSGEIRVRGYDAGRVRSSLEVLKQYAVSPGGTPELLGHDSFHALDAIRKNGHAVTPRASR